jgi:hypothetical protein
LQGLQLPEVVTSLSTWADSKQGLDRRIHFRCFDGQFVYLIRGRDRAAEGVHCWAGRSVIMRPLIASRRGRSAGRTDAVRRPAACVIEPLEQRVLLSVSPQVEVFVTSPALFVENQGQWADE